jgi:hypothetical protein
MKTIEAVNSKTLKHYYNRQDGNLYWFNRDADCWELVEGFSEEDCLEALNNKVQFAFVNGPAVSYFRIKYGA